MPIRRLFFAAALPASVRAAILLARPAIEARIPGIRWETADKLHATLKFLGETPEREMEALRAAARVSAAAIPPFDAALGGLGTFPSRRSPQVIYSDFQRGLPDLTRLAEYLDNRLTELGFPPESRPFRPHVTLARVSGPEARGAIAGFLSGRSTGQNNADTSSVFRVTEFVLVQSEMRPSGSVYTTLESYQLAAA